MDYYRRQSRQPTATGGSQAQKRFAQLPALDDLADESEEDQVCNALFQRAAELIRNEFHENTWQAFWRVVVDGKTPKEVAGELGMKPGGVRVAKSRVLHRLRQELGEIVE